MRQAVLLVIFPSNLCGANNIELTESENESRNNLFYLIPIGSSAIKGKLLLEQNAIQCFRADDKDYLNSENLIIFIVFR